LFYSESTKLNQLKMLRKIVFLLCATSAVLAIPRELSIFVNFITSLYSRIVWRQVFLNVYIQAQSYFVIVRWEIQSAVRFTSADTLSSFEWELV
jgi:hypothetical protein